MEFQNLQDKQNNKAFPKKNKTGRDPAWAAAEVSRASPSVVYLCQRLTEPVRARPIQIGRHRHVPFGGDQKRAALPLDLAGKRARAHLWFIGGAGDDANQRWC
jgi:hypothetical protein